MSPSSGHIKEADVPSTAPKAWALCRVNAPHIYWRGGGKLPVLYTSRLSAQRALASSSSFHHMAQYYQPVRVVILTVKDCPED
jgi:hypothetical protein